VREQLRAARESNSGNANTAALSSAIAAVDDSIAAIAGQAGRSGRRGGGGGRGRGAGGAAGPTFGSIAGDLQTLMALLEDADAEPTTQAVSAVRTALRDQAQLVTRWTAIRTKMLVDLNAKLRAAGQHEITLRK
jgi:hypothetical protein